MSYQYIIPTESPVRKKLQEIADNKKIIIIAGLPGVGKSLYLNELYHITQDSGKSVSLIQWDQARKAFETEEIFEHFPMGDGVVHNGLKLIAGEWLMDTVQLWIDNHKEENASLIVEAPLVGHRFIELVKPSDRAGLESILASSDTCVLMPMPTKRIRKEIEEARKRDVDENAKVWFGAKPSVMQMLWQRTCEIAVEMGKELDLSFDVEYDPALYEFVFAQVLKHRHFVPLVVDEIFDVKKAGEEDLHNLESMMATELEANIYAAKVMDTYKDRSVIDTITNNWYKT